MCSHMDILSSSQFAPSNKVCYKQNQPYPQQSALPDGWTRGGSHPTRYEMGLDDGKCGNGAAAFIRSTCTFLYCVCIHFLALAPLPSGHPGFGTVCQRFYPKVGHHCKIALIFQHFLGKRVKLRGHLCWNLVGPCSWTGMWLKVNLVTKNYPPRTFHLDNMSDRKLTGSSQGNWVECEIVTDIPTNVEALSFGFLLVGSMQTYKDQSHS